MRTANARQARCVEFGVIPAIGAALLGIVIGSPARDLRPRLGDPLLVESTTPLSRTADYLRSDDESAVLRVTEEDGVVYAVEIERERPEPAPGARDSHGIALGQTRASVLAARGTPAFTTANTALYYDDSADDISTLYRFDADIVESIKLLGSGATAHGNAALPHLADPAGTSYATAIVDVSPTVFAADHFRDRYLTLAGCPAAHRSVSIERRDGRTYAVVAAVCDDKKRTLYFDTTAARR